ncbi:hypothetical protein FSB73_17630 [Arachidicoccus ginsenosidivorans]|uniref:Uncharacterized protein n=1 Tax=Arachidicoccus ginsenosidivorans TaxID=496057 RepID=A0A5B8VPR0_9BACT|nr:hypothetical protein [Arachidicoccus ginsenosidivorans]QEC73223.1 hypothetical protein FSB73_17630 [Arachidicoccus ginsenosidivorans]
MQVIGIKRAVKHSPNHINNDATIFQMVADLLKERGAVLTTYHEHEFLKSEHKTDTFKDTRLIFSMSRNPEVLSRLQSIQKTYGQQIAMLNSPDGIEHCFRSNITRILLNSNIATAPSLIIPTQGYDRKDLQKLDQGHGLWLKRGDFHAIIKEDVVFAGNPEEATELLAAFKARNIAEVVASSHLAGDLIKFYGVSGTDFSTGCIHTKRAIINTRNLRQLMEKQSILSLINQPCVRSRTRQPWQHRCLSMAETLL